MYDISELFEKIKNKSIIAIDGTAGSGKTTLANKIKNHFEQTEICHLDQFYKTFNERNDRIGHFNVWNYDYERLIKQVIEPWINKKSSKYSTYNYFVDDIDGFNILKPSKYLIIEGVTSLHPILRPYINYSIWLDADENVRLERGIQRDGERFRDLWINEWLPSETVYIKRFKPNKHADLKFYINNFK